MAIGTAAAPGGGAVVRDTPRRRRQDLFNPRDGIGAFDENHAGAHGLAVDRPADKHRHALMVGNAEAEVIEIRDVQRQHLILLHRIAPLSETFTRGILSHTRARVNRHADAAR